MLIYQGSFTVFSTYVEVIPYIGNRSSPFYSVLHVCGGDPMSGVVSAVASGCSPRMWRWSPANKAVESLSQVFSTYVEVIPLGDDFSLVLHGVLHVCGGDPKPHIPTLSEVACSPRMWRWSSKIFTKKLTGRVFSTYVEVILRNL